MLTLIKRSHTVTYMNSATQNETRNEETMSQEQRRAQEKTIKEIANKVLFVESLDAQDMDDADFYELNVEMIRDALNRAYAAGASSK